MLLLWQAKRFFGTSNATQSSTRVRTPGWDRSDVRFLPWLLWRWDSSLPSAPCCPPAHCTPRPGAGPPPPRVGTPCPRLGAPCSALCRRYPREGKAELISRIFTGGPRQSAAKQSAYHHCLCLPAVLVPEDAERFLESFLSLLDVRHFHLTEGLLLQPWACMRSDESRSECTNTAQLTNTS